jgi:hypothetical protein
MIKNVFAIDECNDIINDGCNKEHIIKAKNKVIEYLQSKNITIDQKYLVSMIHTSSTSDAKLWHYDDNSLINFIVNIKGKGTQILDNEKNIIELQQGEGYIVIGEEGYKFLGIGPTLHCTPSTDNERMILKIMLNANYNLSEYVFGETVKSHCSPDYKNRNKELDAMLYKDLSIIAKK